MKAYGSVEGVNASLFQLGRPDALHLSVTDFGARVVSLTFPDRSGEVAELVCSYKDFAGFYNDKSYFGCTVGRYANRLAKGQFTILGTPYQVLTNEGPNTLHGGDGFDKRLWKCLEESNDQLRFELISPDGDAGFPGELSVEASYKLVDDHSLILGYRAKCTKATPINLTNHAYFNLGGVGRGTILDHQLRIDAQQITAIDSALIPTGELVDVKGGAFDFTQPKKIGRDIAAVAPGYDHNFVLDKSKHEASIELYEEQSGRCLAINTSKPAVQLYTGNFLDGSIKGVGGPYLKHGALCLETQNFPDAPNHAGFPNSILQPGEIYEHTTEWKFSIR